MLDTNNPDNNHALWSIDSLAKYLDVPKATIRDWCYKRTIPFIKVGRLVRFKPKDIEGWLEANRVETYKPSW